MKAADEDDFDDDELLAELDDDVIALIGYDVWKQEDTIEEAKKEEAALKAKVAEYRTLAVKEKQAANLEKAKEFLRLMKKAEADLEALYGDHPKLKESPQARLDSVKQPPQQKAEAAPQKVEKQS